MLDPGLLKDNLEALKINISRRNLDVDIDFLINLNDVAKKSFRLSYLCLIIQLTFTST